MPYNQFSIEQIKLNFGIEIREKFGIFANISEVEYSPFLTQVLEKFVPLALEIDSQKSRAEYITAPILFELKSQLQTQISLFSGQEFTVDLEKGLSGNCDFLISYSSDPLTIEVPFIVFVEAKNDNIPAALGQCMAEMLAAQLFNQRRQQEIKTIYGCVTTGTNWKFLQLIDQRIEIDLHEYYLSNLGQVLGILHYLIEQVE
ncbi:hypothetical protein M595_0334 [Lyngbya aestuarii BL J]|uniref:Uncharacterized protein n=1 Tax=Lyngbya aestuarii BL J TaxID=1348334 RepID=U7QNW0_9CYAN|nr:hypothetical protein [Lyngbya aestuarii]ERT09669.1 hypothetical protein M595_0334 [Lyngbya aestuarii BL J]